MDYIQIIKIYLVLTLLIIMVLVLLKLFSKYKIGIKKNLLLTKEEKIILDTVKIIDPKNKIVLVKIKEKNFAILLSDNGNNLILDKNEEHNQ